MDRAQPVYHSGLSFVTQGPLLMLLPNDMLICEIIRLKTKKVSPEKNLENTGMPRESTGAQGPMENCGVLYFQRLIKQLI